jgi:uncharacterized surface protein with fasciclin (FAS1) repeats
MKRVGILLVVAVLAVGFAGCGGSKSMTDMAGLDSILGLVGGNPELSTLLSLVQTAGIGDLLSGSDALTLLAPSNAAFSALPAATLETLSKPEGKDQLIGILKNHVLSGSMGSSKLAGMSETPKTLLGNSLPISQAGEGLSIAGAKVIDADLEAKNGVVHVIDKVLVP